MRANARRTRVGVALEANRLLARLPANPSDANAPDDRNLWIRSLTPSADGESWIDLAEAFAELRRIAGIRHGVLYVALMPPLSQLRRVDLMGLSESEASRVVGRDPARFLPHGSKRLVIELQGTGWRRRSPFLLVAAPVHAVETIGSAALEAGWSLGAVVPAQLAWATAAHGSVWTRRAPRDVVVCLDGHTEIVRAERDGMVALRRVPLPRDDRSPSTLRALCAERGVPVASDAPVMTSANEAAALAADLAPMATGPAFLPAEARTLVTRRVHRASIWRLTVAVALLAMAGALELFGLARQRASIAAERAGIRHTVVQALVVRESVAVLSERLAAVRDVANDSPRWSRWLATLADVLPPDAFLVSLNAEGDSLHLEGNAARAALVFDALASVRGIQSVRPEGPIRQEVRNGGATSEHFALAALLVRSDGRRP